MRLSVSIFFLIVFPLLASAQARLNQVAHLRYDSVTLAGCGHFVAENGREYALVGTSKGLSIVDLSNPAKPFQRFFVPMPAGNWREVKTWAGFAYVATEAPNSGLFIVDLRALPDTVYAKCWKGDGLYAGEVVTNHALCVSDGYLYLFGGNFVAQGAVICDIADPWNPHIVGRYNTNYIHDGFVRNDTLWAAEIYAGQVSIIDVSDKSSPKVLATQPTPGAFSHNTWLSDDGRTLFTTDEVLNAPLTAFDVSNLNSIALLDVYYPSLDPSREVHNVRVLNNYLINPSYGGQLSLVDAQFPGNLIELDIVRLGTSLVWDADPFLPSGLVIVSTKNEGLFLFKPTYQRAAYLHGGITDAATGQPVFDATVTILNTPAFDQSKPDGQYHTGIAGSGLYTVEVERAGYEPITLNNIALTSGQVTRLDLKLTPAGAIAGDPVTKPTFKVVSSPYQNQLQGNVAAAPSSRGAQPPSGFARTTSPDKLEINDIDHLPNAMYHLQRAGRAEKVVKNE